MGFYDDIHVIDTILNKKSKVHEKKKEVVYPTVQEITILTVHIRRWHVPRQININSGKKVRVKFYAEGKVSEHFKKSLLKNCTELAYLCRHCVRGAWIYIRVETKTHTIWLKGEGEDMSYITSSKCSSLTYE